MKSLLIGFVIAAASCAMAADNPRVFITESQSWQMEGSSGGSSSAFGGHVSGGARPQTGEIIKTFGERCPNAIINNNKDKADYVVLLDHEGGKGYLRKDNKVAVFNRDGDAIVSKSTRSLGSSVQDACDAIQADWAKHATQSAGADGPQLQPVAEKSGDPQSATAASVKVTSDPVGADIEVDGNYVGSTPSTIDLQPGEHSFSISKKGFKTWQRKMKTTGGNVTVNASLDKAQ